MANMYKKMEAGDINADPLFVNRIAGDFHLSPGSSSIDSGHAEARYNDLDGSRNDRGAYGGPTRNTAPTAGFGVTPDVGGVGAFFTFDASTSFDLETTDSNLLVRWDFDGDGVWDTAFSPLKIASAQFNTLGTFTAVLEVRDENGFVASANGQVTVNNQSPNTPNNPSPPDGSTGQPLTTVLSWTGGDPDPADTVTYDVYFGTTSNPPLVSSEKPGPTYSPSALSNHTFYYWKIIAKDNHGNSNSGPVWSFLAIPADTTSPPDTTPPAAVTNLFTGAVTTTSVALSWTAPGDDGNTGTATSYDIRYSTSGPITEGTWAAATQASGEPAPLIAGSSQGFTVNGLSCGTVYYFALKTSDEVPNISAISNSPSGTTSACPDTTVPTNVQVTAPTGGQTISGIFTLKGTAQDNSGTIQKMEFYIDDTTLACSDAVSKSAGSIFQCNWDTTTKPNGSHTVKAKAYDGSGNPSALSSSVSFTINNPLPDLIISSLSASRTAVAGASITVDDVTKNRGTGTAGASKTKFYLSTNNTLGSGDVDLNCGRLIGALPPDARSSGSTACTIPSGTAAGTYYVVGEADGDKGVLETNEGNNTNSSRSIAVGGGSTGSADLGVPDLSAPGTARRGTTITVGDTTKNRGTGTAGQSKTKFYLSTNRTLDVAVDTLLCSRNVPSLAPEAKSLGSTPCTIPAGTVAGPYFIIAEADGDKVVGETNEVNNINSKGIQIVP